MIQKTTNTTKSHDTVPLRLSSGRKRVGVNKTKRPFHEMAYMLPSHSLFSAGNIRTTSTSRDDGAVGPEGPRPRRGVAGETVLEARGAAKRSLSPLHTHPQRRRGVALTRSESTGSTPSEEERFRLNQVREYINSNQHLALQVSPGGQTVRHHLPTSTKPVDNS